MRNLRGMLVAPVIFAGLILAGVTGDALAQAAGAGTNIRQQVQAVMQLQDDAAITSRLQALIRANPENLEIIADAAVRARPDLAVEIFDAVADVAPESAGEIADIVTNAAPDSADDVVASLTSRTQPAAAPSTGQQQGGVRQVPPQVRRVVKETVENPNVVSPSG